MSISIFPSYQVGDFSITAISDGYLQAPLGLLSNIDVADATRMQVDAGQQPPEAIHINCYLIRSARHTALIDAGAGGIKQWGGRLLKNLALAGVRPEHIDIILLTHAHPDHVGGLLDASSRRVFPNAELAVHRQELDFWQDDAQLSHASERARGNFQIARAVFESYRRHLRPFEAGEVLAGVQAVPLPGHTAGHTGYLLSSQQRNLLVWGDIVHFPQIQVARPEVSIAFDQDCALAASTRSRLLDMACSDQLLIAGMHLGELGFACIEHERRGFSLQYEQA
ncbi:MAG: MBL fold metallo-hydrolase [Comamonas sp.]|jgi:glyoxylase-like metal-dependent hydrolase (beta-lactamase superfamily II)|uniref:MBL fold metallo-hydrolase n=1 Tax=Comamonas sp. TaxID=34028 RepID=UPI0028203D40|nr:MBL fold metallo-hydrolase [Comamonas sp.]MDR0215412.1 MBL fold metallo-hydrolase [Comamonas sp.]